MSLECLTIRRTPLVEIGIIYAGNLFIICQTAIQAWVRKDIMRVLGTIKLGEATRPRSRNHVKSVPSPLLKPSHFVYPHPICRPYFQLAPCSVIAGNSPSGLLKLFPSIVE